jgi:hypothetical protein
MRVIDTNWPLTGQQPTKSVCVKFTNDTGTKEVSIAADTSCDAFQDMVRCDIRLYLILAGGAHPEVTAEVFKQKGDVYATNDNITKALRWLKKK